MPDRREMIRALGGALATGLARPGRTIAAPAEAGPPVLAGVEFVTRDMPQARRLSMAFSWRTQTVPLLRALCRSAEGVAAAVRWARGADRPFAVRSSGHCFAGHSMHERLVIDTSLLSRISESPQIGTVTVGPGTYSGDLVNHLAAGGRGAPVGTYGSVCMAGLTLGGGIGYLARSAGLTCDKLESASLVTADGRLVRASPGENEDLFWALRGGGGGSLGIVTEMTFRTVPVPSQKVIYIFIAVTPAEAARILHDWQHWSADQERGTTTHLFLSRHSPQSYLVSLTGESSLPMHKLEREVRRLLGRRTDIPANAMIGFHSPRAAALRNVWDDFLEPVAFVSRCDYVSGPVSASVADNLVSSLARHPAGSVKLTFEALGGAVGDVAADATAYPHRDASYLVEYRAEFGDVFEEARKRAALDEVRSVILPHTTGGAYVNYPQPGLESWALAYWGANLPRLIEVKRKWDPDNVFRHSQSVPVA